MQHAFESAYEVVVIGAGSAGVVAALQAARLGAHTLLVERSATFGGTTTLAGVAFPGLFHAWGRQVIAGIGWELVERCVRTAGGTLPDFSDLSLKHWQHQVRIDPVLYSALCSEALEAAGCRVLLHTQLATAEADGDGWALGLCTGEGLRRVHCRTLIDCSGDAVACRRAGAPVVTIAAPQPASLVCRLEGYELDELDLAAIQRAAERAVAEGRLQPTDCGWRSDRPNVAHFLRARGCNANHLPAVGAHTAEGRSDLERAGMAALLRAYRFLRTQPGLEGLRIASVAGVCGVRESVTIEGETTVTGADYLAGRVFPDAVCHAYYPVDMHGATAAGLAKQYLEAPLVPTVPRSALVPRGMANLLVGGRCLASDRVANSALRVQATAMATGQAVGALAALAATRGVDHRAVPQTDLVQVLERHGAIVPAPLPGAVSGSRG